MQQFNISSLGSMASFRFLGVTVALVWALAAAGCASSSGVEQAAATPAGIGPRYVFLFIGDGMGPGQVELGERVLRAETGGTLQMTRLPVQGTAHTRSASHAVTDSAASATALAAGAKTDNKMVGVLPDGRALRLISEDFRDQGRRVGVLTSVEINNATPAAFYARAQSRYEYDGIAAQVAPSGMDLWAGRSVRSESGRADELRAGMEAQGVAVVDTVAAALEIPMDHRLVILDPNLADPDAERGQLSEAVAVAIERLDGPAGFFMMVEGGAIDWRAHENRGWETVRETLAFDRAIEVAYRFYEQHPDETLILVTADHETGGLSLDDAELDVARLERLTKARQSVEAALPGEDDEKAMTREALVHLLGAAFDKALASAEEVPVLTQAERDALTEALSADNRLRSVRFAVRRVFDGRAGLTWTTRGHSGVDVLLAAQGVGAQRFAGTLDNTEVPRRLRALCGLPAGEAVGSGGSVESSE